MMMTTSKLPRGWRWARLGDVCEIIAGQSPPGDTYRKAPEGLPFFQGKADFGIRHPVARVWCVAPRKIARPGDILISVRAPVGPTNIADVKCCIGRGLSAIKPGENTNRDFILFALRFYEKYLAELGSGSTFSAIKQSDLKLLKVPLPPLEEQKRIVAILNEKMATIERARAAAEAQLEAAQALPAAYLREVFEGPGAERWPRHPLGNVSSILAGITKGRKLPFGTEVYSVPYLRVANVQDGYLDLSEITYIEATESEIGQYALRRGDLLLTEGGDPDKLGRGTFWEEQIPGCIYQNHVFRVRFDSSQLLPAFVSAQMSSPYGKAYFLAKARQTTGIATINRSILSNFPLMIPALSEQQSIVEHLSARMETPKRLVTSLQEQRDTVNAMPNALLRQAFSGEL